VLGLYEVRDNKFAPAQMFYFDTAAVQLFLTRAADTDESLLNHGAEMKNTRRP
jgi:hypothetical protein